MEGFPRDLRRYRLALLRAGQDHPAGSSNARAVSDDIDRMVPRGFSGRVWLYYSARHTHWVYIGNDEGILWRNHLWDRGCPPSGTYIVLQNIAISAMDCVRAR